MPVSRAFSTHLPGSLVTKSPLQVPLTELPQRRSTPRVPFIHLSKSLVNEPPSRFPSRAPVEWDSRLQSLFYVTFRILSKGAPLQVVSQSAHREERSVSRALLQLSLRVPGERTPPHAFQWGPYGQRCPFPQPSSTQKSPVD